MRRDEAWIIPHLVCWLDAFWHALRLRRVLDADAGKTDDLFAVDHLFRAEPNGTRAATAGSGCI